MREIVVIHRDMTTISNLASPARLSDEALLEATAMAAADERSTTVRLVALLGEVDERRLYLGQGCSSLFTYCTQVLRLSEHAAYGRIEAARTARRFPLVLERLAEGALTLTAIGLLRPHLTAENHRAVLDAAQHQSKRAVEQLVVRLCPQPSVPASIRKLPVASGSTATASAAQQRSLAKSPRAPSNAPPAAHVVAAKPRSAPPVVRPLAPERYKLQLTISATTHATLRQVQDLMRHQVPTGDVVAIVDRALTLLLDHLQRAKLAATPRPRPSTRQPKIGSRHIPASVKRDVWARDGGRCAFVGTQGRCVETGFLEFHHVEPFADGGLSTSANLQLRCRGHNGYEAALSLERCDPPIARERLAGHAWSTRSWTECRRSLAELSVAKPHNQQNCSRAEVPLLGDDERTRCRRHTASVGVSPADDRARPEWTQSRVAGP